jgi:hypothetical protein
MKSIVVGLSLLASVAFAETAPEKEPDFAPIKKQLAVEADAGNYEINLEFGFDKPTYEAIRMDLTVLCKDQRTAPNAAKPETEKLLDAEKICSLDDYSYDKKTQTLTVKYSTGKQEGELSSCKDHWQQKFDSKEICGQWGKDERKPANEMANSDGGSDEISAARRRRGVGARTRVRYGQQYGTDSSDYLSNNPFFNGSLFGNTQQQRAGRGRDGLPRNNRREVVGCPHLGVSPCLSAIIAAESGCNAGVRHPGKTPGIGLCAIEIKERHRFGPACADISSTAAQIRCCQVMLAKAGKAYFGGRTRRIAGAACGW